MAKDLFIQKGLVFKKPQNTKFNPGISMFSLTRWLKETLRLIGVQFEDCCEQSTPTGYSVRMNIAKNHLEYYDPIDFTWKTTSF